MSAVRFLLGLALQFVLAVVLAVGAGTATLAQLLTDWPGLSDRAAGLTALAIGAAINLVVFHAVRAINRDSDAIQARWSAFHSTQKGTCPK